MAKNRHIPYADQFVKLVKQGFQQLDPEVKEEIRRFIAGCQHPCGAFTDRNGSPDLYYSLFGVWMATALDMYDVIEKHKAFINKTVANHTQGINYFALTLIRGFLFRDSEKPSPTTLITQFFRKGTSVNPVYRVFLWLLIFDLLYGKPLVARLTARLALTLYRPPSGSPCSIAGAYLAGRAYAGLSIKGDIEKLFLFYEEEKGFKIFDDVGHADLLSTGVALFALRMADARLDMVVPACLQLAGENYDHGAFLSGDGDNTRDLEYTFYGLLIIGSGIR